MASFESMVSGWAKETEARMTAVYRRSVEMLADELTKTVGNGGKLPFKTGNLMRSLLASTSGLPRQGSPDQAYTGSDVGVVAASLKLGDPVWLGYQANYAHRMNYGFVGDDSLGRTYNQTGFHFVEAAIAKWPDIVTSAAKEIQGAVQSR